MARVSIRTPAGELLDFTDLDDNTAADVVERLTVSFGKRGGTWVVVPSDRLDAQPERGTELLWVPSTSKVMVSFESSELPERAGGLSVQLRPKAALGCSP